MKKIFIICYIFISASIFSGNLYLDIEPAVNPFRISISSGISRVGLEDPDEYYKVMFLSLEEEGNVINEVYETFFSIQLSKRIFTKFYIGGEVGINSSNSDREEYYYEMSSFPLLVNVGYQLGLFNVTAHGGIQIVQTKNILVGPTLSYPLDFGIRISYAGFELKGSYLYTFEKTVRKGLIFSLGYNLLLL